MYVSETDVQLLESHAARRAAVVAGLGGDFVLAGDVLDSVRGTHPELAAGLSDFLKAYRSWYEFHRKIEAEGREGNLTPTEVGELTRLVQRKDAARARFTALVAPGPEEAPIFVEQCLDPMETHVKLEISYLTRKSWTWRFHLGQCELLQPLEDVAGRILASRGILTAGLRDAVPRHDALLEELVEALKAAQKALESHAAFGEAVNERTAAHRAANATDTPWGAFGSDVMPQLAAQFVINNVEPGTSSDSTMNLFWASNGPALKELAEPVMAGQRPRVQAAADKLLVECRSIGAELLRVRGVLQAAYGV